MTIQPIPLPKDTSPSVERFVRRRVERYIADARAMLALPRPEIGIHTGCEFALVEILCAVISGLSRVFRSDISEAGKAFKATLELYPHHLEPMSGIAGEPFAAELWDGYRCNLTHSLGINVRAAKGAPRAIEALPQPAKILRVRGGSLSIGEIEALDDIEHRPNWLGPTLWIGIGRQYLCAEALYWGTRLLVARLCAEPDCVVRANGFLTPGDAIREQATHASVRRLLSTADAVGRHFD
jgi:hypothetical protein